MAKQEYKVGQLAEASQTKAVTIRYYEREGLLRNPPRTDSGYRVYDEADLDRLLFIRRSRKLGFSVGSIRELLELSDNKDAPCDNVDARVAEHLSDVRKRMAQLRALEVELERLNTCCKGGGVIRDCRIIEALSVNSDARREVQ